MINDDNDEVRPRENSNEDKNKNQVVRNRFLKSSRPPAEASSCGAVEPIRFIISLRVTTFITDGLFNLHPLLMRLFSRELFNGEGQRTTGAEPSIDSREGGKASV